MIAYFALGLVLGAVTGIPIGPVGVAVIDAAQRHSMSRAFAVAVSGGLGDLVYASLGVVGVGELFQCYPCVPPVLQTTSGVVLIAYGATRLRKPPMDLDAGRERSDERGGRGRADAAGGLAVGLGLVLANPASLITWVVIVGGFMAGASRGHSVAIAVGIGLGSATWFVILAHLARWWAGSRLSRRSACVGRLVGSFLFAYGFVCIGRSMSYWAGW